MTTRSTALQVPSPFEDLTRDVVEDLLLQAQIDVAGLRAQALELEGIVEDLRRGLDAAGLEIKQLTEKLRG